MDKRQKILRAMMETARAKTAQGADLRDVVEATWQTRDDARTTLRQGITLGSERETDDNTEDDSTADIPLSIITIGNKRVLVDTIDHDELVCGYDDGYETCHHYRRDNMTIYASTLLFQVRNGWNDMRSDLYNTGVQVGWLAAFLEQEEGQLARTIDVGGTDAETYEQHTETV